jgi:hypothetical protein
MNTVLRPCYSIHPDPKITSGKCNSCRLYTTRQNYYLHWGGDPSKWCGPQIVNTHTSGLGDLIESALSSVGVTEERVKAWVGDCGCSERKQRLNTLSDWALRVLGLIPPEQAKDELDGMVGK